MLLKSPCHAKLGPLIGFWRFLKVIFTTQMSIGVRAGNSVYLGNQVASQKKARDPKTQEEGKKEKKGRERKKSREVRRKERGISRKEKTKKI